MIDLSVNLDHSEELLNTLKVVNDKLIPVAINRATKKLARYLSVYIARLSALELGIKVSDFKRHRTRITYSKEGRQRLWVGTDLIKAHHLKNPRWRRSWVGVKAGGQVFEGSFLAHSKTKSGDENGKKVFRRIEGHYGKLGKSDKESLMVVSVSIDEMVNEVIKRLEERATARLKVLINQELRFELSKL